MYPLGMWYGPGGKYPNESLRRYNKEDDMTQDTRHWLFEQDDRNRDVVYRGSWELGGRRKFGSEDMKSHREV